MSGIWRLFLVYCAIASSICLGTYWTTASLVRSQAEETALGELQRAAFLLLGQLQTGEPSSDISGLPRPVDSTNPYRISIIDSSGRITRDSLETDLPSKLESLASRREVLQARSRGVGTAIRYSTSVGATMAYVAVQIPGSQSILRLGRPHVLNRGFQERLQLTFFLGGLMMVLSVALFAWFTGSRWQRSERILRHWTVRMAGGEFPERLPLVTNNPLGPVARSLENLGAKTKLRVDALQAERDHLGTVLDSMLEGVLVVDRKGRISDSNPAFCEIFRLQKAPRGKQPLEVIRLASVDEQIAAVRRTGRQSWDEIKTQGRVLRVHFTAVDPDPPSGVVVVFNDISDLRRLEQLRKEFVSNVSHELKTPLTAIQGYAETLSGESQLDRLHHQFLAKIVRNARQLSAMIDQMLNLARVESQNVQLALERLDFNELVDQLQGEFREILVEKRLALHWSAPEDSVFVADRSYIYQVFRNLLENAVKYTGSGEIRIRMESEEGHWLFVVEDTGIGIPEEDLKRIFERFYRVHKDRSRETGGSGIGLAIVKHIVQLHHGQVWAESRVNSGTRFSFTLPHSGEAIQ